MMRLAKNHHLQKRIKVFGLVSSLVETLARRAKRSQDNSVDFLLFSFLDWPLFSSLLFFFFSKSTLEFFHFSVSWILYTNSTKRLFFLLLFLGFVIYLTQQTSEENFVQSRRATRGNSAATRPPDDLPAFINPVEEADDDKVHDDDDGGGVDWLIIHYHIFGFLFMKFFYRSLHTFVSLWNLCMFSTLCVCFL